MKLELRLEDNPQFNEILIRSNDLWGEMVAVTRALEPIKIPKLWPWMAGRLLKNARRSIDKMTTSYNEWYQAATNFARNPEMTIGGTSELERAVNFLHYLNVISGRINELESKFYENERDYRELASISRGAKALFWSMAFFCSSTIISIVLAVISIVNK